MSSSMDHVDFARINERFVDTIPEGNIPENNWIITIRFYIYLHYVEERLKSHNYNSRSHRDRDKNIRSCKYIDNEARKIYRKLEDVSRDARYECIEMEDRDVRESESALNKGKQILGFDRSGGSHKYSID